MKVFYMSDHSNPYSSREPVRSEEMFFGRSRELQEIAQFLRGNQSVSLVGPPGIGKTSLLLHLMRPLTEKELGLGNGILACYLDCETAGEESTEGVLRGFAAALMAEMKSRGLPEVDELRQAQVSPSRLAFESAVRALNRRGLAAAILLDDFERLSANTRLGVSFFNALRSAAGRLQLAYLTTSADPLIDITYTARPQETLSSPFFNIFSTLRLGLLDESDARDLIQKPATRAGRPFPPDRRVDLYRLAGGHPLILQTVCRHAWEHPDDSSGTEAQCAREMQPHFERAWLRLTEAERRILLGTAGTPFSTSSTGPEAGVLREIENQCLFISSHGKYAYPGKLWADFVMRQSG
jgi:hypothetical protein